MRGKFDLLDIKDKCYGITVRMINGFWQCTKKWGLRYDQSKCKSNQVPVIYGMTLNAHFSLHEREWDVINSEDRGQRTDRTWRLLETTTMCMEKQVNCILVKSNKKI
jgi:hypothetical protein